MKMLVNKLCTKYARCKNRRDFIDFNGLLLEGKYDSEYTKYDVIELLNELKGMEFDIVWLFYVEKWKISEIATEYRISKSKIYKMISAIKSRILSKYE